MTLRELVRRYLPVLGIGVTAAFALVALLLALDEGAAVQATAFATLSLCAITGWYAWLTHRMVAHGHSQTKQLRRAHLEQRRSEALILANLADRVGAGMRELPPKLSEQGFDGRVREGALWSRDDLRELETLSAALGPWASGPLVDVTNFLLWMDARVREIQQVPVGRGYDYRAFPAQRWETAWRESDKHLGLVAKLARDEAERLARELQALDSEAA